MKKSNYFLKSLINAAVVFLYVFTIAWFLFDSKNIIDERAGLFIPLFMLLLLIISATITGSLVLGKPILLYLDGKKKDAFVLLFSTLGWLVVFLISVFLVIFFV